MSRAAAEVGSTANSYQILAKLASGGMAEIFLARGGGVAGVERHCVLKRILRDRAGDVHFVRMFLEEARLAAQLQHPNIAQVYDIGKLGDSFFFTMEYVHGETVRAILHRAQGLRRALPVASVLTIVAGAAAGLHHAHVRVGIDGRPLGIVHRDVSPSNLMVSYEGGVKLVDFGVAKAADRPSETRSGTVKGKISYLSPEQCRGTPVDRRSDLFSLGICLWEMLTCERLYRRSSDFENMNAIVVESTPRPSSLRPDLPPEVDELVLRLLAKDPDDRFQSADEVVEAIEAVAAGTGAVLSASALGRFVRELFGQRPEPWVELESRSELGEAVTVTSEPIPPELALPPGGRIDQQLSSVIDLSPQRQVTESLGSLASLESAESLGSADLVRFDGPTAQIGKPLKRGLPLAAPPPTQSGLVRLLATSSMVSPAPVRPTGPSVVAPPPVDALTPSLSGQVVLPAPHATPSGPFAVTSPGASSAAVSRTELRRGGGGGWPLYAVIGGAALVGSIAVMVMMRSGPDTAAARVAPRPGERAGSPNASITVEPIEPAPADPAPAPAMVALADRGAVAAGPRDADGPGNAAHRGAVAPARPVALRGVPPRSPAPAVPPADRREAAADDLPRLYAAGRYDKVVAECSGPVSAEHAPLCFLAACHVGNAATARRLITAVPAVRRDPLTASCKQLGINVAQPDCDADPMACQH